MLHLHANRATAGTCLEIFADQLLALLAKNIAVLRFRLASSFAVLCAPAIASLILWLILRSLTGADTSAVPLGVSKCAAFDVYSQLGGGGACLTLGYAPKGDPAADAVASALASAAGWSLGSDIVGYASAAAMAGDFYDNPLRQVDFAVVIDASAGPDKMSYTCVSGRRF